jgi:DNA adenine methylase
VRLIKITYVKSPLNYVGGKHKLLPQILPLFPNETNRFFDLFCGGGNVAINVNANLIYGIDIQKEIIEFLDQCTKQNSNAMLNILKKTINKYKLSKTNREGFEQIRKDYNNGNKTWNMFYAMVTNAFNYQIRFNKKGEYNMPFGKDTSNFNPTLEKKFIDFVDAAKNKNIIFINTDFRKLKPDKLKEDDFVYCDPPLPCYMCKL